jgi:hypothetical protein
MFGVPMQVGGVILNDLGARVRDGIKLAHGQELHNVVRLADDTATGLPVRLVNVPTFAPT